MSRVGIVGIGHGVFGRRSDASVQELAFEAFRAAMEDAGIERGELDSVEQIMERSGFDGMQTTNQALLQLVQAGEIDGETALAVSLKTSELAQALRGRQ